MPVTHKEGDRYPLRPPVFLRVGDKEPSELHTCSPQPIQTLSPNFIYNPSWVAQHIFDDNGQKQSLEDLLKGPMAKTWTRSTRNELGRLSNVILGCIKGTRAIGFIKKSKIPKGKKITYANFVCDYRPLKKETH